VKTLSFDIRIAARERVLVDVREFTLPANRITVLFGESGIGKSLVARAIYGLLDPEEFNVRINGAPYEEYLLTPGAKQIKAGGFFVFQEPSSHLNPLVTLGTQLKEGDLASTPYEAEILRDLWDGGDASDLLSIYPKPYRPSGGEKQRLFLAMALKKFDMSAKPEGSEHQPMFVFDEPTGSLDNHFRNVFLSLLFRRFQKRDFTTLLITHDYSMVNEITRAHTMSLGRVSFRELAREDKSVVLRTFEPKVYFDWLDGQQASRIQKRRRGEEEKILKVESGVEVFGWRLEISREPEGGEPAPMEIHRGGLVYMKAPSGLGKTTLVKMMMGLIRGKKLRILFNGEEGVRITEKTPRRFWQTSIWGKKMTMTFQHADEALNPRSTVAETFRMLPARKRVTDADIRRTLGELFDEEITDEFLSRPVSNLSGGQKQRLNLLRGFFLETDILILDEPLNGLDFDSTRRVIAKLREKQDAGKGILLISHNEEIFDALIPPDSVYYLHRA
jgi:ABC-type glutathione transport system ATPase component